MSGFGYLFWTWTAVSLLIFIARRIRSRRERTRQRSSLRAVVHGPVSTADGAPGPVMMAAAALRHDLPAPASIRPTPDRTRESKPAAGEVLFRTSATVPPTPAEALPDMKSIRAMQTLSVSDLLTGVILPCELAPLTSESDGNHRHRRAVFATTGWRAGEVFGGMAEALRAIGYEILPTSDRQLSASGARGELRVTVHANPIGFPTAADNSVVVEVEL